MCLREGACMHGAPVEVRGQLAACGSQGLNDRLCNRCRDCRAISVGPNQYLLIC